MYGLRQQRTTKGTEMGIQMCDLQLSESRSLVLNLPHNLIYIFGWIFYLEIKNITLHSLGSASMSMDIRSYYMY